MKITYKTEKPKTVPFLSIPIGQVFLDGNVLCLKIRKLESLNVLCLGTYALYLYADNVEVIPINAELIVDGEGA
jgi:hypothetical protein